MEGISGLWVKKNNEKLIFRDNEDFSQLTSVKVGGSTITFNKCNYV